MSDVDEQHVATVDNQEMVCSHARNLCKRMFYAGFAGLPWLWFVNAWLFWPDLRHGGDPTVQKYARLSATGFSLTTLALLTWIGLFSLGQGKILGNDFFRDWNLADINPDPAPIAHQTVFDLFYDKLK